VNIFEAIIPNHFVSYYIDKEKLRGLMKADQEKKDVGDDVTNQDLMNENAKRYVFNQRLRRYLMVFMSFLSGI